MGAGCRVPLLVLRDTITTEKHDIIAELTVASSPIVSLKGNSGSAIVSTLSNMALGVLKRGGG